MAWSPFAITVVDGNGERRSVRFHPWGLYRIVGVERLPSSARNTINKSVQARVQRSVPTAAGGELAGRLVVLAVTAGGAFVAWLIMGTDRTSSRPVVLGLVALFIVVLGSWELLLRYFTFVEPIREGYVLGCLTSRRCPWCLSDLSGVQAETGGLTKCGQCHGAWDSAFRDAAILSV